MDHQGMKMNSSTVLVPRWTLAIGSMDSGQSGKTYPTVAQTPPAAPPPNSVSAFANEQPDADACKQADVPVWKGYTVLTEEELEERKRKQLSDVPVVLESRMRKRRGIYSTAAD